MPTLLPVCAPTHPPTPIPTPSAPLHQPTPLPLPAGAGVGGGSVGVVGSVTTWCTHWLCWCCPLPSHTHRACEARGGGGCVWCGCHHHCAPFPPTTTTVCAAPPCPLCVCVLVVGLGTAAHCGGTHAGVALCLAPGHHTHLPRCPRLSPLSSLLPPNPPSHTHTQMALLTPHTHGVLCVPRPIHSLTHWLPHCPHTLHTHWWVCVCSSTCSHAPSHTQRRHRRGACLAALVLWSPPPRPLCHTHTHRDWWWAPWWWLVVGVWALCGCHATPPTRLACHHTRHIHHHTHHGVLFVWHALPLPPPPLNPITHTPQQPLCHNGGCHWSPRRPHTPHTCHTHATHTPRASTGVAVAFGVAPPPRWCWPFAVFSSSLLVHQPLSLSLLHALTHPLIPSSTTPPSHPSPVCGVCCGNGLMDGPHCG